MNNKNTLLTLLVLVILAGAITYGYYTFFQPLNIAPALSGDANALAMANDFNSGNLDGAITLGEQANTSGTADINSNLVLAAAYAQKGSVTFNEGAYAQKAIDIATQVIQLGTGTNVQYSEAYRIIGYANEISNKFDEARANYDRAIALDPANSQAYSNKGHSFELQGDLASAEAAYNRALQIDPHNEHALLNKARIQVQQLKLADATVTVKFLLAGTSNTRFKAEGNQLLAFILMNQNPKDYDGAYDAISLAINLDPTVPQSWVTRGLIDLYSLLDVETEADMKVQIADIHTAIDRALALNANQASAYYLAYQLAKVEGNTKLADDMKARALAAIPLDITLGASEKTALRDTITAVFTEKVTSK